MDEFSKLSHPSRYPEYALTQSNTLYWKENRVAMRHVRKMYCAIIKLSHVVSLKKLHLDGPFLDLLFYFTVRLYYPCARLCVLRWDHLERPYMVTTISIFGCLLAPSSWMACQRLDRSELMLFRECPSKQILQHIHEEAPDLHLSITADLEADLLFVFRMYTLNVPLYKLLPE